MAVEYDISSDVAVIKETGSVSQCARVTQMYSGQITYDDEAGSKFATATINGKSQRVMLCIAVNGTVNYDDVPSLYSTVDGHRCLNIVTPTETGTPDDVPSLYETVVIDGKNVRAVRCIMINKTPVYDGVSSTCTFTGDDGKTHTAQLVNKITGGSVVVIIKGTSPLNLPDAVANSLRYVKAFGGTEQGLPDGYTQLEYLQSDGNQMIDLGFKWTYTIGTEVECEQLAYASLAIGPIGVKSSAGGIWGDFASSGGTHYVCFGNKTDKTYTMSMVDGQFHTWAINNAAASIDGVVKTTDIADSNPSLVSTDNVGLFGRYNGSGDIERRGSWRVKYAKIYDSGLLIHHFVPARRKSDAVLGMFDLVSGQFFTNAGTGTFTAGADVVPTPDAPIDIVSNNGVLKVNSQGQIYTDGTVETIVANSKNYLTRDGETTGQIINTDGTVSNNSSYNISAPFTLPAGDYTCTWTIGSAGNRPFSVYKCDANGNIILAADGGRVFYQGSSVSGVNTGNFTLDSTTLVRSSYRNNMTDLAIFSTFGPATAEMLLKVGDYQDEQEILSGAVTRNVGVKVLDGTEPWIASGTYLGSCYTNIIGQTPISQVICSHFQNASGLGNYRRGKCYKESTSFNLWYGDNRTTAVADLKQFLADQYAAGTPVIIVYPLATPTTESVAGQHLQVTDGDNTLEITQASLNDLELEAEYSAVVTLTVQEVEDANLDNNVEVTIS